MKLRSAGVWALQVAGGARWQPRIRGRDPDMQGVVGCLSDMHGTVGRNPDTRGVVGHLLDMQSVVGRYFAIFRALSVRISPEDSRTVRNAPDNPCAVRISPDNPRVVRIVPDNANTVQISPGNGAAQPRHDRRAKPPAPHRQLRTAGADPQPDRSAAKSSSPSHRHPRSRCAGCPLPCNRPPDRRSCLSAQSAQDCIQPS